MMNCIKIHIKLLKSTSNQESSFSAPPFTSSLSLGCFCLCVCLAGGARPHEKEMQVPRDVRQLPAEDLLAGHAGVPAGGFHSQRTLPHRHAHQGSQPEHWTAGPLTPQQP